LSTVESIGSTWAPRLLSVLRIVVGLLFLEHGTSKLFGFPATAGAGDVVLLSLVGLSGILEFVGGLLMTVGLFTRLTAFVLSGEMAFAYFIAHAPKGFFPQLNHGEPAIFYCFTFLYFAAAGAGPWSIDARRR
jgi:putative oxidoreductase